MEEGDGQSARKKRGKQDADQIQMDQQVENMEE